ncbi:MAG: hypothetical protein HY047_07590 [Acidobacteria bacterium]|nr:hypothetical protein [Acidobacteriota bacterium]
MKMRWITMVTLAIAMSAARANAQSAGVRAGVSGDPDQFYLGVHLETDPLMDHLRFRPNAEIGVGSNTTLVALNFEFAYTVPQQRRAAWNLYLGAGPALDITHVANNTRGDGGFNILIGLAHRQGLFTELKVGALSSPSVKFGVGYTFPR